MKKLLQILTLSLLTSVMISASRFPLSTNDSKEEHISSETVVVKSTVYASTPNENHAEVQELVRSVEKPRFTEEEIDLIALVTMAEAEGESELGQRLVIDTILNRVDADTHPDTVHGVIYQNGQFTSMTNGRVDRCYVKDEIRELVVEEMESRMNYDTIFFHAGDYSKYGTPLFSEGNHYFSSYE